MRKSSLKFPQKPVRVKKTQLHLWSMCSLRQQLNIPVEVIFMSPWCLHQVWEAKTLLSVAVVCNISLKLLVPQRIKK